MLVERVCSKCNKKGHIANVCHSVHRLDKHEDGTAFDTEEQTQCQTLSDQTNTTVQKVNIAILIQVLELVSVAQHKQRNGILLILWCQHKPKSNPTTALLSKFKI